MKKLFFFICLVSAFVLAGCHGMFYSVREYRDEPQVSRIISMDNNFILGDGQYGVYHELNAQKLIPAEGEPVYSLAYVYSGLDWIYIEEGESLILQIDGETIKLEGEGSSGHRRMLSETAYSQTVEEKATYVITEEILRRLAGAESIKTRIDGSRNYALRRTTEDTIKNFKDFVTKYVE